MELNNLSSMVFNTSELTKNLPPEITAKINHLFYISKIALYIFIAYLIFLILKTIYTWRRNFRIDAMYHKINEIDEKLNKILEKLDKKPEKTKTEPVKKKSILKKLFKINHKKEKKKK